MPRAKRDLLTCRRCGAPLEATAVTYVTLERGGFRVDDLPLDQVRFYCANDHAVSKVHRQALEQYYARLDGMGREPGSGGLEVLIPLPGR